MKTQTYNTVVNIIGFVSGLLAVAVFGSALLFFFCWLVLTGASNIFGFAFSIKYLTIMTASMAIPIFAFSWTYIISCQIHGIDKFRDFWVIFGHEVELEFDDTFLKQRKEMIAWCDENCDHLYKLLGSGNRWIFWKESEALAFKLMWL